MITLSALVTGRPAGINVPKPLPGETMATVVLRNHPQEWQACVERLKSDLRVSESDCARLRRGEIAFVTREDVRARILGFINFRVPNPGRTLEGLADLRSVCKDLSFDKVLDICDFILPRQRDPSGDTQQEDLGKSLGFTVISLDPYDPSPLDLGSLLRYVHGKYLWMLPSGSRIPGSATMMLLMRVLRIFEEDPMLALYYDGSYCMVYRTSALHAVIRAGGTLSPEMQRNAAILRNLGFGLTGEEGSRYSLVEIERLYGGNY